MIVVISILSLSMSDNPFEEITLSHWAHLNNIPMRTAQGWAKKGKINVRMKKMPKQILLTRLVRTYVIDQNAIPPSID